MWNEEYKDEYINFLKEENKQLKEKLSSIKLTVDFFKGIDNDFIVKCIIDEFNGIKQENKFAEEIIRKSNEMRKNK